MSAEDDRIGRDHNAVIAKGRVDPAIGVESADYCEVAICAFIVTPTGDKYLAVGLNDHLRNRCALKCIKGVKLERHQRSARQSKRCIQAPVDIEPPDRQVI